MSSLHALSLSDNPHEKEDEQVINLPSTMRLPRKAVQRLDYIKQQNRSKRSFAIQLSVIEGSERLARKYQNGVQNDLEICSEAPVIAKRLDEIQKMRPDLTRDEIKVLAFSLGVRELWFRGGDATGVEVLEQERERA